MHHCPKCSSRSITMESAVEGVRVYSCMNCGHSVETTEMTSETLRWLLDRSLRLAQLQHDARSLEETLSKLS